MRLRYKDIEIEGKDQKEIEWLLERVQRLASELKPAGGGEGARRGAKEKFIEFPKGKFTVLELADSLEISSACINQRLLKMEETGDAQVVDERRQPGQRGRPTKVWKIINFPPEPAEGESRVKGEKFEIDLDEAPE